MLTARWMKPRAGCSHWPKNSPEYEAPGMKAFRFPLQRVLDWRKLQLRAEEEKLAALQRKLAALVHRENALKVAQSRSEAAVLGQHAIPGFDLRALAEFEI